MLGVVLGLILTIGCAKSTGAPPMSAAEVVSLVNTMPLGTSRERVIEFLDQHHIENSGHSAGVPTNKIYSMFRNVEGGSFLISKSIQVIFTFRNSRLSGRLFKNVYTGP